MTTTTYVPGTKPPEKMDDERLAFNLRICMGDKTYKDEAVEIEAVIKAINQIKEKVFGHSNQKQMIEDWKEEAWKPYKDRHEGVLCFRIDSHTSAYNFLLKPQNFEGNVLKLEILNQGIENLQTEASDYRDATKIMQSIAADKEFDKNPDEYIAKWLKKITDPSAAESKVIQKIEVSYAAAKEQLLGLQQMEKPVRSVNKL